MSKKDDDYTEDLMYDSALDGIITVQLTSEEITGLVNLLEWTIHAARVMADLEMKQGGGMRTAKELYDKAAQAKVIAELLIAEANIGEPEHILH